MLWMNLITDGAPALALGTEKGDPDIMERPPRPPSEPIINRLMQIQIGVQTIAASSAALLAYWLGLVIHPEPGAAFNTTAATMAFVTLSFSEIIYAYTVRSERYSILRIGPFGNRNMNLAFVSSSILLLAVIFVPLERAFPRRRGSSLSRAC